MDGWIQGEIPSRDNDDGIQQPTIPERERDEHELPFVCPTDEMR
jgi:hypothetical protein